MKQVLQSYRDGEVWLAEVPSPTPKAGQVLVQTAVSVVSPGTERAVLEWAQKPLWAKAAARPDLVRQVLARLRTEGFWQVWRKVAARLEEPVPLGYSCAGTVVEAGARVADLRPGDRVACGGAGYATHAEYNAVPRNLCVKLPQNVDFDDGAFATLGAIALQAVRQAETQIGERVVVLGLGVIGLLTVALLRAAGCPVLGCDPAESRRRRAAEWGAELVAGPDEVIEAARAFTEGRGADAVIVTASTSSNRPIEQAGDMARMRGRVVVVGAVGLEIPRDVYYRKELELRLSRSYGPGRYDPEYEEYGRDYPFGYVRWTEQRNMAAFLELVAEGRVKPSALVTHRFAVENALSAYDLLLRGSADACLAVLMDFPHAARPPSPEFKIELRPRRVAAPLGVGLIGAGRFGRGTLLPALARVRDVQPVGICSLGGRTATEAGERYGFSYATTRAEEIFRDDSIHAVVIATRHDTHAELALAALRAGKHTLVEKPLATTPEQLDALEQGYRELGQAPAFVGEPAATADGRARPLLMVGYNRRFSRHARAVRSFLGEAPGAAMILYRVNAGEIEAESWIQDWEEGGGRVVGEVCHFVDLCEYLTGSPIARVHAEGVGGGGTAAQDSVAITLRHVNGALSALQYTALGPQELPKERVEIFAGGRAAIIENFARTMFYGPGAPGAVRGHDKGFEAELEAFFQAVREGGAPPIPVGDLFRVSRVTFAILESLRAGKPVAL